MATGNQVLPGAPVTAERAVTAEPAQQWLRRGTGPDHHDLCADPRPARRELGCAVDRRGDPISEVASMTPCRQCGVPVSRVQQPRSERCQHI